MINFAVHYDMILFGNCGERIPGKGRNGREPVCRLDGKRLPGVGKKK